MDEIKIGTFGTGQGTSEFQNHEFVEVDFFAHHQHAILRTFVARYGLPQTTVQRRSIMEYDRVVGGGMEFFGDQDDFLDIQEAADKAWKTFKVFRYEDTYSDKHSACYVEALNIAHLFGCERDMMEKRAAIIERLSQRGYPRHELEAVPISPSLPAEFYAEVD